MQDRAPWCGVAGHEDRRQLGRRPADWAPANEHSITWCLSAITSSEFACQIDVPPNRVSQIISGKRAITGDTAFRFGRWFGIDPQFWLKLQSQFDLA